MDVRRGGFEPSGEGPAAHLAGMVRIDPLFDTSTPARIRGAGVTVEPGARQPLARTLIVTSGLGWTQRRGGPVKE